LASTHEEAWAVGNLKQESKGGGKDREWLGDEIVVSGFCNVTGAMEEGCEFGIDVVKDRLSVFSTESDREEDLKS
jgi:hypothetical protein